MKKYPKIALLGNPNAGKSTLFNQLTGLNQKTGNFPGVTVDKLSGTWQLDAHQSAEVVDLPGLYSLFPQTHDERVVLDLLCQPEHPDFPNLALVVVDASNLKRNLLLFSQIADLQIPVVIALNMLDVASDHGIEVNSLVLQKQLGVPVVEINAKSGIGLNALRSAVLQRLNQAPAAIQEVASPTKSAEIEAASAALRLSNRFLVGLYLSQFSHFSFLSKEQKQQFKPLTQSFDARAFQANDTIQRYQKLDKHIAPALSRHPSNGTSVGTWSQRLDAIFLHRWWGYVIFVGILLIVFQSIFSLAEYPMNAIELGFGWLTERLKEHLPAGQLTELLTDGVLSGLSGVIIFVPQIAILFAFFSLLEESGYMSRVMFILDKILRKFGLSGRSVVPLVSGMACAVPAIMSARTIGSWKDRLITILVTPLMSCSARLPVYAVLIGLVIPDEKIFGIFSKQGLVFLGLYLLGFMAAILSAWVLSKILRTQGQSYFVMELPTLKIPRFQNILLAIWNAVRSFILEAGKVILAISIVLWVLSNYGPGNSMERAQVQTRVQQQHPTLQGATLENAIEAQLLENSYAGRLGKIIEPAIAPLGYDWKIGIALVTSFAAREVFVGSMSTIYSVGKNNEDEPTVRARMAAEVNPRTGRKMYDLALGMSLLIFYAFAMQCMSTLATTYRETKSWKYPILQLVFMTGLAYLAALGVYQVLR
jgi:ferrous iron transport protein B